MEELKILENYLYISKHFIDTCKYNNFEISFFNYLIFLSIYNNDRYISRKIIVIFNSHKSYHKVKEDFKDHNTIMKKKHNFSSYDNIIFVYKSIHDIDKLRGSYFSHIMYYNEEYNGIDEDEFDKLFDMKIRPTLVNCIEEKVFLY